MLIAFMLVRSMFSADGSEIREATMSRPGMSRTGISAFGLFPADFLPHTWSLATEEQFYLLWPIALIFIAGKRRPLLWIGAGAVVMLAIRLASRGDFSQFGPARPVGLMVGCGLAFLPIDRWRLPRLTAPRMLVGLVAIAIVTPMSQSVYLLAPLATSLATAVLIVCTLQPSPAVSAVCLYPVRYVGKISYGLYLYHYPMCFLLLKFYFHSALRLFTPLIVASIFAAASLSYEFVEKPILGFKGRFQAGQRRAASGRAAGGLALPEEIFRDVSERGSLLFLLRSHRRAIVLRCQKTPSPCRTFGSRR